MKFNPEISLGTLVEICMFAAVIIGGAIKVGRMETKLDMMYTWFQRHIMNASEREEARRATGAD